ncbi:hypothetical protein F5Y12DRAFT_472682 [Xylaria sp. FL1777]|nr:hypothetical protein F5Y12DRAFT_472682 [Xylaria sp. FL1777]
MPPLFKGFLSNLFPGHEGASAEVDNPPQQFDSKALVSWKNENDEPRRKRARVHEESLPEPEVISLLSSDEEGGSRAEHTSRVQNQLQHPHDPEGILNVYCSGKAVPLQSRQIGEYTDTAPILNAGEDEVYRDTNRVGMSLYAEPGQQTHVTSTEHSLTNPSAPLASRNLESHPIGLGRDSQDQVRIPIKEPSLCPEQAELVDIILSRRNVFYTGSAGCGKSTVLKAFTRRLRDRGLQVDIVAPTGISALGVGGSTTFVYAGWGLASFKQPLDKLRLGAHGKYTRKRLKDTDVLVIDEISSKSPPARFNSCPDNSLQNLVSVRAI